MSKILLIEKSKSGANVIENVLNADNHFVYTAQDEKEAVDMAGKIKPDMVIIDINSRFNGNAVKTIKNSRSFSGNAIPIVLLAGKAGIESMPITEHADCEILNKPFGKHDLLCAVKTAFLRMRQKKSEDELRNAHNETKALLSSLVTILIGVSPEDKITHWNSVAEDVFTIKSADAIGRPFMKCGINWDWERVYEGISLSIFDEKPLKLDDLQFSRPDDSKGFLNIRVNSVIDHIGKLRGYLLTGEDITTQKKLMFKLAQAQKLESIGQLSSGIAHEINTPLQYISGNMRFLKDGFDKLMEIIDAVKKITNSPQVPEKIKKIGITRTDMKKIFLHNDINYIAGEIPKAVTQSIEGIEKINKIVLSMKQFANPGSDTKAQVDINNAIDNTVTITRNEWKYVADVITHYDSELPCIACYPGSFSQALLNIMMNSIDAIKEKTGPDFREKGKIEIATCGNDGHVEIKITDTGTGIHVTIMPKIFDPFFTTKAVGKGTGQGLATAYDIIVNLHKGHINFYSEYGAGTTCIIRLPMNPGGL